MDSWTEQAARPQAVDRQRELADAVAQLDELEERVEKAYANGELGVVEAASTVVWILDCKARLLGLDAPRKIVILRES